MHPLLVDPDTQEALQILEDKFASLNHTGPMDVAAFVGDPEDDDLRQDASALILDFVKLCRGPQGRGE
jgi:hypothetical protein